MSLEESEGAQIWRRTAESRRDLVRFALAPPPQLEFPPFLLVVYVFLSVTEKEKKRKGKGASWQLAPRNPPAPMLRSRP